MNLPHPSGRSRVPDRAWAEFKRQPLVWLIAVSIVASAVLSSYSAFSSAQAADRLELEVEVRDLEACLAQWESRTGSRRAIDLAVTGVVNLLDAIFPNANPELEQRIREQVVPQIIADAQAEVDLPECDREAAERRLDEIDGE